MPTSRMRLPLPPASTARSVAAPAPAPAEAEAEAEAFRRRRGRRSRGRPSSAWAAASASRLGTSRTLRLGPGSGAVKSPLVLPLTLCVCLSVFASPSSEKSPDSRRGQRPVVGRGMLRARSIYIIILCYYSTRVCMHIHSVHAYYTCVLIAIIVCILTTNTLVVEAVLFLHFCDASKSKQRLKEEATLLASGGLLLDHTVHWSQKVVPEGRKGRVRSYKNASSSSKMAENAALVPRKSSQPPQVPSSP